MPDLAPIGSYGLTGDTRTAALLSEEGAVDWLCVPRFDGDPLFGRLIDPRHGGHWSITPEGGTVVERRYEPNTSSLVTRWSCERAEVIVHEGMVADVTGGLVPQALLVRRVTCTGGPARMQMTFDPRYGLPGRPPQRDGRRGDALVLEWGDLSVSLRTDAGIELRPGVPIAFDVPAGRSATFVLGLAVREPLVFVTPSRAYELLRSTDRWWKGWTERFDASIPHRETVLRSLITLRQLTYAPSGAPVAAPTTSLPAPVRSDQTWDYRFAWPRDAAIGVGTFLSLGSTEEPRAFLEWFVNASRITRPRLDVLYTLDGRRVRREREIAGVDGYAGGRPVRVGNAAGTQLQLDPYGWVIDAAWRMLEAGQLLTGEQWKAMRGFADFLADNWEEPDNGIWEVRTARRHFVHSKLMAWHGLDRALALSRRFPLGRRRAARWRRERDRVAEAIRSWGVRPDGVYRRAFDGDDLDASLLTLPALGFEPSPDRLGATIDAVRRDLGAGGPLVYRYRREPPEGAFLPCSFWLVQALATVGRLDEAREIFDELCSLSTPLGLYAEQIDPATGAHVGNFPQALTHAALLQAACALTSGRAETRGGPRTPRARTA